jgi:hypothetical protein
MEVELPPAYHQYFVCLDHDMCRAAAQRRGESRRAGRNTEEAMIRRGGDQQGLMPFRGCCYEARLHHWLQPPCHCTSKRASVASSSSVSVVSSLVSSSMPHSESNAITPWCDSLFTFILDVAFLSCHGRSQILFALVPRFCLGLSTKLLRNVLQVLHRRCLGSRRFKQSELLSILWW